MALSLILRSAHKAQGYSYLLRCSPIAFKSSNSIALAQITNRTSTSLAKKAPVLLTNKILTTPTVRCMSEDGDHRMKWKLERLLSVALLGLLPFTVISPSSILDNLTAIVVTLHLHWGIEAIAEDYVRPVIFGNVIPKLALVAVYAVSAITLGGLLYFNHSDVGIGKFVRKLWAIKPHKDA